MVEPRTLAAAVVVIQPGSGPSEPYIGRGSVAVIVPWSAGAVADDGLALRDAEVERGRAAGVGERAALAGGRAPRDGPGDGRADGIAAAGLVGGDVLVDVGAVGCLTVAAVGVPRRAVTVMPASVARASKVWKAAGSIQSQVGKPTSWSASAGGEVLGLGNTSGTSS